MICMCIQQALPAAYTIILRTQLSVAKIEKIFLAKINIFGIVCLSAYMHIRQSRCMSPSLSVFRQSIFRRVRPTVCLRTFHTGTRIRGMRQHLGTRV